MNDLTPEEQAELDRLEAIERQKNTLLSNPREKSLQQAVLPSVGPEATTRAAEAEMASRAPWEKQLYGLGRAPQSLGSGISQLVAPSPQKSEQERTARALETAGGDVTTAGRVAGEMAMFALPLTRAAQATPGLMKAPAQALIGGGLEALRATPGEGRDAGERLKQGAQGAAIGAVAGAVPRVLKTTLGGGITTPTPEAEELIRRGVRLTPGQQAGPSSMMRGVEDRAAGFPFVGEPIAQAQRRGFQDFSNVAIEQIVSPLNPSKQVLKNIQSAPFPTDAAREFIGENYQSALRGRTMPTSMGMDVANRATAAIQNADFMTPDRKQMVIDYVQKNMMNRFQGPGIPAEVWKDLDSDLGRHAADMARSSDSAERRMGWLLQDVQDQWRAAAKRVMPRDMAAKLEGSDAAYRDLLRGERAAGYTGKEQNLITPARLQRAETSMARGKTPQGDLADLARTGQAVLPSAVPDSGTGGRMILPMLAGGVATGLLPKYAAVAGTTHAGYSRPGVAFLGGQIPGWSKGVRAVADWLAENGLAPTLSAYGRAETKGK